MTYATKAGADAIVAVLRGLAGLSSAQAQVGVPEGMGARLYATVTAGSQVYVRQSVGLGGLTSRDTRYTVMLYYQLNQNEEGAEDALMDVLDALMTALPIGHDTGYGQVMGLDTSLADLPDYQVHAGKEYREYPILITLRQFG